MHRNLRRTLLVATMLVGAEVSFGVMPALAQVDTIIVEARKREESLQDVPLSVTAFDQNAIERTFSNTLDEIERYIPNVELSNIEFSGQTLGASIRGVSFADLEKSFEPAVGFSIDGVFLGSNTGAAIDIFDIEQIEVLRGPQGTLYGRNTVGGVINVRRTRPTGEAGMRLATRIGRNAQREFLVVANAPAIGDVLSSKFYFFSNSDETYAENLATGEPDDAADSIAYGGAFLFEPNDRLEALVSVDVINDDSFGAPVYNLTLPNGAPFGAGGNACDFSLGLGAVGLLDPGNEDAGCRSASLDVAEASDFEVYVRDFPFINFIDGWSVSSNIAYDVNENLTLTSVTGYRESDDRLFEENLGAPNFVGALTGGVPTPFFVAHRNQDYEQFSQELRLDGTIGDRFTFVSGAYYLNTEYSIRGGEGPFGTALGQGTAFILGGPVGDFTANQELNAFAIFADGTYDITDRLSFSGGVRYTYEEKDFDIDFIISATNPGESASASEEWTSPTGRAILQYDLSDDAMIFGGWSRGFRSGGFNGRGTTPTSIGPYDPETVDSFEFGMRSEVFDNRLRFNPTGFYAQYKDKQEEIIRAAPGGNGLTETIVENASDVTIWGLELEALAQPTEELTIRGSAGYLNTEIDEFRIPDVSLVDPASPNFDPTADPDNLPIIDVADTRALRRAPEYSFSIGADYVRPISNNLLMTFTTNYSWSDEFATSPVIDVVPGERRHIIQEDGSADFALTVETMNDEGLNLSLTGYVNDAFDGRRGTLSNTLDAGVFYFGAGRPTTVWGFEGVLTWQ